MKFEVFDKHQRKKIPSEDIAIDGNGNISITNLNSDVRQVEDLEIKWIPDEDRIPDKQYKALKEIMILKLRERGFPVAVIAVAPPPTTAPQTPSRSWPGCTGSPWLRTPYPPYRRAPRLDNPQSA